MTSATTDITLLTSWDFEQTTGAVPIAGAPPMPSTGDHMLDIAFLSAATLLAALSAILLALAKREEKPC